MGFTKLTDKRNCKYYKICGNSLNCSRCNGFEKETKVSKKGEKKWKIIIR